MNGLEAFLLTVIAASTPLLLAGALAGAAVALPFVFLTQALAANQVASGLALALFGLGLSGLIGEGYVGQPGVRLERLHIPGLSDLPFIGPVLFGHDVRVYLSFFMTALVAWFLFRTRWGLILRAVGTNHHAAHALGHPVRLVRTLAILFGGVMAGLAGAYLSVSYTPQWVEDMTAGRGWIALALVVFATWRPLRALAGAYLFGAVWILGLHAQAAGFGLPPQFLTALPYLATIAALVLIARNRTLTLTNTPAMIGQPFMPER